MNPMLVWHGHWAPELFLINGFQGIIYFNFNSTGRPSTGSREVSSSNFAGFHVQYNEE